MPLNLAYINLSLMIDMIIVGLRVLNMVIMVRAMMITMIMLTPMMMMMIMIMIMLMMVLQVFEVTSPSGMTCFGNQFIYYHA